jgi:hypothetical protein
MPFAPTQTKIGRMPFAPTEEIKPAQAGFVCVDAVSTARSSGEVFVIYLVPLSTASVQISPRRFRTV